MLKVDLTPQEKAADAFSRKMIRAQHLNLITRQSDDRSPPDRILEDWLRAAHG